MPAWEINDFRQKDGASFAHLLCDHKSEERLKKNIERLNKWTAKKYVFKEIIQSLFKIGFCVVFDKSVKYQYFSLQIYDQWIHKVLLLHIEVWWCSFFDLTRVGFWKIDFKIKWSKKIYKLKFCFFKIMIFFAYICQIRALHINFQKKTKTDPSIVHNSCLRHTNSKPLWIISILPTTNKWWLAKITEPWSCYESHPVCNL